jgi:hypothetical protein
MLQVSDISQINILSLGIAWFCLLEIIAQARLKSILGSSILNHLAIFRYTSDESSFTFVYLLIIAKSISSFELFNHLTLLFG